MKEFLFVFRRDVASSTIQVSAEQIQAISKPWQDWIGGIAAQNKLVSRGSRLGSEGKVVRPDNVITDGPYVELKEAIGGHITVRADSMEEAIALAQECPILAQGGNVEIRTIVVTSDNG